MKFVKQYAFRDSEKKPHSIREVVEDGLTKDYYHEGEFESLRSLVGKCQRALTIIAPHLSREVQIELAEEFGFRLEEEPNLCEGEEEL